MGASVVSSDALSFNDRAVPPEIAADFHPRACFDEIAHLPV